MDQNIEVASVAKSQIAVQLESEYRTFEGYREDSLRGELTQNGKELRRQTECSGRVVPASPGQVLPDRCGDELWHGAEMPLRERHHPVPLGQLQKVYPIDVMTERRSQFIPVGGGLPNARALKENIDLLWHVLDAPPILSFHRFRVFTAGKSLSDRRVDRDELPLGKLLQ
jgi:hypothetical protein